MRRKSMAENKLEKRQNCVRPRGRVFESGQGRIQCVLEMPGVRKEDLEIRIENNELRILGRRQDNAAGGSSGNDGSKYLVRERRAGDFVAAYTLDETVDQAKVDAALDKGILTVTLELKEAVKPRSIKVRTE